MSPEQPFFGHFVSFIFANSGMVNPRERSKSCAASCCPFKVQKCAGNLTSKIYQPPCHHNSCNMMASYSISSTALMSTLGSHLIIRRLCSMKTKLERNTDQILQQIIIVVSYATFGLLIRHSRCPPSPRCCKRAP